MPSALQAGLGAHRLAGAVFADSLWTAGEAPTLLPVIESGFAAIEAEFVARIGPDVDPSRTDWTLAAAAAANHVGAVSSSGWICLATLCPPSTTWAPWSWPGASATTSAWQSARN